MPASNSFDIANPGSAVSNREDLTNIISTLEPLETPFVSMMMKAKCKTSARHDWSVHMYDDPNIEGIPEGTDVINFANKIDNQSRLGNYATIIRRTWQVTKTQEKVDKVGPMHVARSQMQSIAELKRDMEAHFLLDRDSRPSAAGVAGRIRGIGNWINSAGPEDVPAMYRTPAGAIHSAGDLSEAIFTNMLTALYRVSGNSQDLTLLADTALRTKITGFSNTAGMAGDYRRVNQNAGATLTNTVSVYQGDYGMITVINMNPKCAPDRVNMDTGYLYSNKFLRCADLWTVDPHTLEDQGGGMRGYVDWSGTLECLNPGAFGKITAVA